MIRTRLWMSTIVSTVLLTLASAAWADVACPLGRWDLDITYEGQPIPSWLEVARDGSQYAGRFCGECAGVYGIGKVEVDGTHIRFQSHRLEQPGQYLYTYTGTIEGNRMSGTRISTDGVKQAWTARLFTPRINVAGTWHLEKPGADRAEKIVLQLTEKGGLAGTLRVDAAATQTPLMTPQMRTDCLVFITPGKDGPHVYQLFVRGDRMEGFVTDAKGKQSKIRGQRQRQWGRPVKLFNGKDLTGWKSFVPVWDTEPRIYKWTVVDGVMTNAGRGANIVCEKRFKDFKLHVEFRVPPKGNSGVYLRGRYEVQVADSFGKKPASHGVGGMYSRITPASNPAKAPNEWQAFDITLIGQYLTVVLNGETIIDNQEIEGITGGAIDSLEEEAGPIYLQGDHGKIEYRNLVLTPVAGQ